MRAVVVAVLHALAARLSEWIYDGDASLHQLPPWLDINESRVNLSYTLASRIEPTGTSSLRCDSLFVDLQGAEESYRILAVIFRGTTTAQDWIANAGALPDYDKFKDIGIGVHAGWKAVATYPEYVNRTEVSHLGRGLGKGTGFRPLHWPQPRRSGSSSSGLAGLHRRQAMEAPQGQQAAFWAAVHHRGSPAAVQSDKSSADSSGEQRGSCPGCSAGASRRSALDGASVHQLRAEQ